MTMLAATTVLRAMMFMARTTLRMIYPGPARDEEERIAILQMWYRGVWRCCGVELAGSCRESRQAMANESFRID
jgi:hypothetical protein